MRKVYLADWTPNWEARFKIESNLLKDILGPLCVEIHHIGSTAVKGIKAKPVVDILIVVCSHKALDQMGSEFARLGYRVKGENGIKGRRYFQKGMEGVRAFHIHAFEAGDYKIVSHLKFRDKLRKYPEIAGEYEQLKIELAEKHKFDRRAYTNAKSLFIQQILGSSNG